jgi:sulfite oxidase
LNPENFLAYELEGKPLPVLHGFPLRAIFPTKDGNSWVKWLVEINVQ